LKIVLLGLFLAVGCGGGPQPCSVHLQVREGGVTLLHYNVNASCTRENLSKIEVADSPAATPWLVAAADTSDGLWSVSYTDTQSWHQSAIPSNQITISSGAETFDLVLSNVQLSGVDGGTIAVSGEIIGFLNGPQSGF
jgi:hypothetical protein